MKLALASTIALALVGCGSDNPCDVASLNLTLTGNYDCTDAAPCAGIGTLLLSYEDPTKEPRMTLGFEVEVGDGREYDVSLSMHDAILGEGDSFPNRSVGLVLDVPNEGLVLQFPDAPVETVTEVEKPEYEGCKAKDEERLLISFDRVDAEVLGGGTP